MFSHGDWGQPGGHGTGRQVPTPLAATMVHFIAYLHMSVVFQSITALCAFSYISVLNFNVEEIMRAVEMTTIMTTTMMLYTA